MWKDILKSDPCTRKVKKVLYVVLEKLGANNELLDEIKTQDENTLREMMEEFSRTQDGNQKEIFSNMLEGWDMCIQAAKENPTSTTNFDSDYDMMYAMQKSRYSNKNLHPLIERAMKTATTPKTVNEIYDEIFNQIDKENELRLERNESSFSSLRSGKRTISSRIVPTKGQLSMLLRKIPWMEKVSDRAYGQQMQTWVYQE